MKILLLQCLYRSLWWLVAPAAVIRLFIRSRHERGYIRHIRERFGWVPARRGNAMLIWLHAVSVGETRAAQPLVTALMQAYPQAELLITHMTPAGRATGEALFGQTVTRCYLPYDMTGAVTRFLKRKRPSVGIVMETEVWPTLIGVCHRRQVPLVLANARMSERSFRRAARFGAAASFVFGGLTEVFAQTAADAERLDLLGARKVSVLGNLKFDMPVDAALVDAGIRWRLAIGDRPVWVAASTREGEEALVLDAYARQAAEHALSDTLLILVPRHPQRFDEVHALARSRGFAAVRRSEWAEAAPGRGPLAPLPTDVQVLLGDSMGEMAAYFAAADLAFIGGSLVPTGGQNLIEAAGCGTPVLIGPHTFNFTQATKDAIAAGAARRVATPEALAEDVTYLLNDAAKLGEMGMAARQFADRDRGATDRTVAALARYLTE